MAKGSNPYTIVKLPKDFVEQYIDKLVGKFGYTSRTEVCKDAVRMRWRELNRHNPEKEGS